MPASQPDQPCPPASPRFRLSARSAERLASVHKDLAQVVRRALQLSAVDFTVLEGRRSPARQQQLYQSGATRTLNSRHLTGHAVDLGAWVAGGVRWDWPLYEKINHAMQQAAAELGVPLEWGGDWKSFADGPHFQLPWRDYPAARPADTISSSWGTAASGVSKSHPEEPPQVASRRIGRPPFEARQMPGASG